MSRLLIHWAGGKAVRLTPDRSRPSCELKGVIFGGGADIDPARYRESMMETIRNESKKAPRWDRFFFFDLLIWLVRKFFSLDDTTQAEDRERDAFEFRLIEEARGARIPILGICRGAQLINVFFGGSLYEDLTEFHAEHPELRTVFPRVEISIVEQSRLWKILGKPLTHVNSLHHQSVKELGRGLRITARTQIGIVQAIESTGTDFVMGVQWHPEFLPFKESQRRIFREFVVQAAHSRSPLVL